MDEENQKEDNSFGLNNPKDSVSKKSFPGMVVGLIIVLVIILGLGAWFMFSNDDSFKGQLVDLNKEIEEVISKEASELSECKSIAFGSKPCGGPWTFLVYSESSTDVSRLEGLVSQYNEIDKERNQALGLSSDCSVPNPPAIGLEDGICTY